MASQSNEAIIRAWVEQGLNGGDLSLVDTYMAPDSG
jgi:hypothetical protein